MILDPVHPKKNKYNGEVDRVTTVLIQQDLKSLLENFAPNKMVIKRAKAKSWEERADFWIPNLTWK